MSKAKICVRERELTQAKRVVVEMEVPFAVSGIPRGELAQDMEPEAGQLINHFEVSRGLKPIILPFWETIETETC
jgi:hypothetical protein